jgi:hypothetical protein
MLVCREFFKDENLGKLDDSSHQSKSLELLQSHGFGEGLLKKLASELDVSALASTLTSVVAVRCYRRPRGSEAQNQIVK